MVQNQDINTQARSSRIASGLAAGDILDRFYPSKTQPKNTSKIASGLAAGDTLAYIEGKQAERAQRASKKIIARGLASGDVLAYMEKEQAEKAQRAKEFRDFSYNNVVKPVAGFTFKTVPKAAYVVGKDLAKGIVNTGFRAIRGIANFAADNFWEYMDRVTDPANNPAPANSQPRQNTANQANPTNPTSQATNPNTNASSTANPYKPQSLDEQLNGGIEVSVFRPANNSKTNTRTNGNGIDLSNVVDAELSEKPNSKTTPRLGYDSGVIYAGYEADKETKPTVPIVPTANIERIERNQKVPYVNGYKWNDWENHPNDTSLRALDNYLKNWNEESIKSYQADRKSDRNKISDRDIQELLDSLGIN